MTIAVDAMGGDLAPRAVVEGAVAAAVELGLDTLLVGRRREIESELRRLDYTGNRISLVEADEVVAFDEPSITPIRKKRRASVRVAAECVRSGRARGMFTAGHTGAAMVVAKMIMGVLDGIDRPALAAVLPGLGRKRVLLDVGANVSCRPEHYREFALMGHFYAQEALGVAKPKIGLMSVGEEEGKGTDTTREVFGLLKSSGLQFVGNVEGRDVYSGDVDVIVTDGFTGNVILKVSESLAHMVEEALRQEITRSLQASMGFLLSKDAFRAFKKRLDYSEVGGAPLLGVNGACLIGHGRSNAKAVRNAIRAAHDFAAHGIPEKIRLQALEFAREPLRR
ncbi:MAG TPA: phosphate acyltransferase PlsX [Thermoanaerobaculia bacterium]|nr:phosphate acyltransferase PlsX [Thermoanaerobaculia bacterium]HQR66617.1 phosphate acyltransferase PlsX [Thermoanaerobaculia bacterium]